MSDWRAELEFGEGRRPDGLILLGPSGGWCLPTHGFIQSFSDLIAVDPDPVARTIFMRRIKAGAQQQTWVPSTLERVLPALLTRHPSHAVLFCNVLGSCVIKTKRPWSALNLSLVKSNSCWQVDTGLVFMIEFQVRRNRQTFMNLNFFQLAQSQRMSSPNVWLMAANGWTISPKACCPQTRRAALRPGQLAVSEYTGSRPAGWRPTPIVK